jgi:hypothetical protein
MPRPVAPQEPIVLKRPSRVGYQPRVALRLALRQTFRRRVAPPGRLRSDPHPEGGLVPLDLPARGGRLAAPTGDTAGSSRAYRHYLALRPNPEPEIKAEVDRVRTELVRLSGDH